MSGKSPYKMVIVTAAGDFLVTVRKLRKSTGSDLSYGSANAPEAVNAERTKGIIVDEVCNYGIGG